MVEGGWVRHETCLPLSADLWKDCAVPLLEAMA